MAENNKDILAGLTCPRQLYGYDLKIFIKKLSDAGHQTLICGDFNSEYIKME